MTDDKTNRPAATDGENGSASGADDQGFPPAPDAPAAPDSPAGGGIPEDSLPPYGSPYGMDPSQPAVPDGTQALAGTPLAEDEEKAGMEDILAALKTVYDPEIPVNIHDLGLIYSCDVEKNGDVEIFMTLTAPACPVAGQMPQQVADAVAAVDGVGLVAVTLTWQPPWTQERMSDDARLALGMF